MQTSGRVKHRYITGFDGLRALSVIGVILYHLNPTIFQGGYLGVPVFMVLSGYLVTDHLLAEYETTHHFRYGFFWSKRIKKLYPTLLVMLVMTSAYITLFQRNLLANLWQNVISNIGYVYNWWQISHGQSYFQRFANNESPFTHLWTLSIEGQFYLLWPLIVVGLMRLFKNRTVVFYTTVVLSLVSALLMAVLFNPNVDPSRIYYGTDTRMFSLLMGAALATFWPSQRLRANVDQTVRWILDGIGAIGFLGMLSMLMVTNAQSAFLYRGGMVLFSFFTLLIAAAIAHPASHWNQWLSNPVFSWFGSRSYGIYVYQFPIMIFFSSLFPDIADHLLSYSVIQLALIFGISEVSYRLIEKPFGRFDYHQIGEWLHDLVSVSANNRLWLKRRVISGVLTLISLISIVGIIQSTRVNAAEANHSQLAEHIERNAAKQKKQNAMAKARLKSQLAASRKAASDKSYSASLSRSESKAAAKISQDPATQALLKYGLSAHQIQAAQSLSITSVGDSVMLGGRDDTLKIFQKMYMDAAVSRQAANVVPLLKQLDSQGILAPNVLIGLGTNGPFDSATMAQIMSVLGSSRHVFWINIHVPTRPWQDQVNQFLKQQEQHYHNLKVIDWYDYSKNHPSWFYSDQTHPNPDGLPYYTTFVAKEVLNGLNIK